ACFIGDSPRSGFPSPTLQIPARPICFENCYTGGMAPVKTAPEREAAPVTDSETKLAPLYRVLIHNDDVTPMDFVIFILVDIFKLEAGRAVDVMMEAHTTGVAHVITEPLE